MDTDNEMCFGDLDQMERRQLQFCNFFSSLAIFPFYFPTQAPLFPMNTLNQGLIPLLATIYRLS